MRDIALDKEGFHQYAQEQEQYKRSMSISSNSRPTTSSPERRQSHQENQEYPGTPIGMLFPTLSDLTRTQRTMRSLMK